jgi:protein TonB
MAQAHHLLTPPRPSVDAQPPEPLFLSLGPSSAHSRAHGLSGGVGTSMALHAILLVLVVVVPTLLYETLPEPGTAVKAFFVAPLTVVPPPPPPPPPPAGAARAVRPAPVVSRPVEPAAFVAPIDVPDRIEPQEAFDLGVEGGVPGGVEGGVPGGVVGGVVGGLPSLLPPPPPPTNVVRVGGDIKAPKLARLVHPEYPKLAAQARVTGLVLIEARVGVDGVVKEAHVLRGHPLLDAAALEAVRQWRYVPLLLNGVPMEFILTVNVKFAIGTPVETSS